MADTALKFGPEWLRALTEPQGGTDGGGLLYSPVSVLPNMKLAEFRYGREEMLALFDKNVKYPEELAQFGSLFVEKTQFPLNLMQMGEEESRAWQRGANSDASLRPFGPPGKRPPSPTGGRGRGRGRGSSMPYYDRNRSMDDDLEGRAREREAPSAERGFPRGRGGGIGFERQTSERGWFDRNDRSAAREEDVNGGVSPRKGYTRAPFDDWRRGGEGGGPVENGQQQGGESGEGWRTSGRRWGGAGAGLSQGQGWRSGGDRENNYTRSNSKYGEGGPAGNGRGAERWKRDGEEAKNGPGGGRGAGFARQRSRQELPEWAHDDPQGESGSFDHEGKWRPSERESGGRGGDDWGDDGGQRWEEEEVDPEDLHQGPGVVQNGVKEDHKEPPSDGRARQQSGREGGGGDDGEVEQDPSQSAPDWDSIPATEPPKHKTSGDHLEYMAGNLVDSLVNEPEEEPDSTAPTITAPAVPRPSATPPTQSAAPPVAALPPAPPKTFEWSYLDPQGMQQGPFQPDEMFEWHTAGYFPADLMVKRDCDLRFASLTEVSTLYGRNPFTPGPAPPPLGNRDEEEGRRRREEEEGRRRREEEERLKQQQLLVQQMMMQQQHQQLLAQQHQQHLLAMQQQQQQQQQQAPSHLPQFGGAHPLLGGLGLGGHLGGGGEGRGFPSSDPLRSLLGPLHSGGQQQQQPQQQPEGPSAAQDPLKALLARQQQAFPTSSPNLHHSRSGGAGVGQNSLFGGLSSSSAPHPAAPDPPTSHTNASQGFDPIQSLLQQLQGGRGNEPATSSNPTNEIAPNSSTSDTLQYNMGHLQQHQSPAFSRPNGASVWDLPPSPPPEQSPTLPTPTATSVWGSQPANSAATPPGPQPSLNNNVNTQNPNNISPSPESSPGPATDSGPEETLENHVQEPEVATNTENQDEAGVNFVKPKSNEKKDKKSKKAEEKRKAKEKAKKEEASGPYIPGMSAVKPEEQVVAVSNVVDQRAEEERRASQEAAAAQRAQQEALVRVQEEQRQRQEREEQQRLQQERLAKLAPWAKKETSAPASSGEQLSLAEIQRREAERDRAERAAQEVVEARAREEARWREEEERRARAAKTINWATVSASGTGAKVKSLAEIQAEEARVEKERQERENASRQQATRGNSASTPWGSGKATSWAGKIAAASPAPTPRSNGAWNTNNSSAQSTAAVVAPAGFWDPVVPEEKTPTNSNSAAAGSAAGNKKNKKNKNKKAEEEAKVKQIFGEKKPKNEFEDWCTRSLQAMQAQVDIPTFLGFLMDIESPYEVHDYIKSYVGEEKAQKRFAVEYLERRSRWKRSLKGGAAYEDDLTTPAHALTPGAEEEFKEAGGKKGKKVGKNQGASKMKGGKQDMSHLLGFSVSGQGVNRGELDMPH